MPNDVKSAEEAEYNKPGVANLLILLTEATRAQQDSVPGVFIPPAGIEQVESKRLMRNPVVSDCPPLA
jgi:hypothetical protein